MNAITNWTNNTFILLLKYKEHFKNCIKPMKYAQNLGLNCKKILHKHPISNNTLAMYEVPCTAWISEISI